MDLEDTNTSQQNYVHCSNFPHNEATITKQSTDEDNYHHLLQTPSQPPSNRKRQLSYDNEDDTDVPAPKKSKANDAHHRIAIIIPIMAKRLPRTTANYSCWRRSGFDVVLVYNEDEGAITKILDQHASDTKISFITHAYTTRVPPNAGIAYHLPPLTPPLPPNRKHQLSCDDDMDVPVPKKFKANDTHHRIAIIIPIMAKRLPRTITNYGCWIKSGFDVVLVYNRSEEGAVTKILDQYASDTKISFVTHPYTTSIPPNAGIAKHEAYRILKQYLDRPDFQFALLLDDTVNDIINTFTDTEESIMTTPTEFYHAVEDFAAKSPVFGGIVAHKRHPEIFERVQEGIATVKASFLQQALLFSCRGTPTLEKHFRDIDNEYIAKIRRLNYWKVPFGEDVAFQVSLYEQKVLSKEKSPQFWGIGISRIPHKSSTRPAFDQLEDDTKKEMREMLIYLHEQKALSIKSKDELTGVRIIPGGPIRIRINGCKGERPWREAFNYTLPCSTE